MHDWYSGEYDVAKLWALPKLQARLKWRFALRLWLMGPIFSSEPFSPASWSPGGNIHLSDGLRRTDGDCKLFLRLSPGFARVSGERATVNQWYLKVKTTTCSLTHSLAHSQTLTIPWTHRSKKFQSLYTVEVTSWISISHPPPFFFFISHFQTSIAIRVDRGPPQWRAPTGSRSRASLQRRRGQAVNVRRLLSATSIQIISLTKATVPRGADVVLFEVGAVDLPTRGRSLQLLII